MQRYVGTEARMNSILCLHNVMSTTMSSFGQYLKEIHKRVFRQLMETKENCVGAGRV